MPAAVVLPAEYPYVLGTVLLSGVVNFYHGIIVSGYRKAAGVKYPTAYASEVEANQSLDKYRFNCAQRAHANYLESWPQFVTSAAIGGLFYPKTAAAAAMTWIIGRVIYARGYSGNAEIGDDGKGRIGLGFVYALGQFTLWGLAGWGTWSAASYGL